MIDNERFEAPTLPGRVEKPSPIIQLTQGGFDVALHFFELLNLVTHIVQIVFGYFQNAQDSDSSLCFSCLVLLFIILSS